MINKYALAFAALAVAQGSQAQGWITLTDEGGNDVTNGSVTLAAPGSNATLEIDITTELNGGSSRVMNVKRYELSVIPTSRNYFCWGQCYLDQAAGALPLWVSGDYITMSPGVEYIDFHGYHMPVGTYGLNAYRFVWYDTQNPTDSAFVDLFFDNTVGIQELAVVEDLSIAPNPANASATVNFNLSGGSADAITVYNALGAQVLNTPVAAAQRNVQLNTSGLREGVYFVSLQQQGRAISTQRLVVTR
ncbi:MAG: T9SS type A sorting domain-containing protein [Flavobacteriales bacterium]